jgi:hypothetical protein
MLSSLTQTSKKAECSEETLVHIHGHSMIPIGSNALGKIPILKRKDTIPDQETTMDKDLREDYTWCHHDASNKPKLGKTHVTLFQKKSNYWKISTLPYWATATQRTFPC